MILRVGITLALSLGATQVVALNLPSGLSPELQEVLVEDIGAETWARFRFALPELGAGHDARKGFVDVADDFAVLCADLVLPYLAEYQIPAARVVISMADRFVEFGTSDPDVTQFFEQFRIENGDCIWEGF